MRQLIAFIVVGALNTGTDFLIFNLLFDVAKAPLLLANICAASVAMTLSLYLNRRYVFKATHGRYGPQIIKFLGVTLVGIYAVQNLVIYLVLHAGGNAHGLATQSILQANIAKASGVLITMVWNFTWYKSWVFKGRRLRQSSEESEDSASVAA